MKINIKSRGGFTIFEMIIYILIFGIIATLATTVFNFAIKEKIYVGGLNAVQVANTQAMSRMVAAVHSSAGINGASSTLSIVMASSSINPTIFSLSGGAVMIQQGAASATAITPANVTVTALTFTLLSNASPSTSSVQIKLSAEYNNNGTVNSSSLYSLQTTAMPL